MKIGLIRHFKVDVRSQNFLNSSGFDESMRNYDRAEIIPKRVELTNNEWQRCISSTLPRAKETASAIFSGEILFTDMLVEVPMRSFWNTDIKIPSFIWHIGARIAWKRNHSSQIETYAATKIRVNEFIEKFIRSNDKNTLIVTHGFFMRQLYKALIKEGFEGKIDEVPKNGVVYVLSR
ncbi:MAG: phosphoglycerate mutase family protein [Melioribacteraceae bacterium]|nr:phosphoglycerate mutase family protein [Melioribacteraceae bacterium]